MKRKQVQNISAKIGSMYIVRRTIPSVDIENIIKEKQQQHISPIFWPIITKDYIKLNKLFIIIDFINLDDKIYCHPQGKNDYIKILIESQILYINKVWFTKYFIKKLI